MARELPKPHGPNARTQLGPVARGPLGAPLAQLGLSANPNAEQISTVC